MGCIKPVLRVERHRNLPEKIPMGLSQSRRGEYENDLK
jgi:hypothetical protein